MSALVGFMVDMTVIALMSSLETAHHLMPVRFKRKRKRKKRVQSKVFLLSPSPHIYLIPTAEFIIIKYIRYIR